MAYHMCVIPYGKRHPVVLRWISIKNLSMLFLTDLLQQVVVDMAADRVTFEVEVYVHVFTESTRVVVPVRLGVTERFQDTVRLQKDILDSDHRVTAQSTAAPPRPPAPRRRINCCILSVRLSVCHVPSILSKSESCRNFKFGRDMTLDCDTSNRGSKFDV